MDNKPTYSHEYNDYGTYKRCTIVSESPDESGYVVIMDAFGEYRIEHKDSVRNIDKITSPAEKWLDENLWSMPNSRTKNDDTVAFTRGELYDLLCDYSHWLENK
jgi:hypothetical protein